MNHIRFSKTKQSDEQHSGVLIRDAGNQLWFAPFAEEADDWLVSCFTEGNNPAVEAEAGWADLDGLFFTAHFGDSGYTAYKLDEVDPDA